MARRTKAALEMADGTPVRNIDDLKKHFDVRTIVNCYLDGSLLTWLQERFYDDETEKVEKLSKDDDNLASKLCAIFEVETPQDMAWRAERLKMLRQYTNDENILAHIEQVAFEQDELADIFDEGFNEVYLCANRFVIPLRVKDKTYIGVGDSVAVIRSDKPVNFNQLNIKFENIAFDDKYKKILSKQPSDSVLFTVDGVEYRYK